MERAREERSRRGRQTLHRQALQEARRRAASAGEAQLGRREAPRRRKPLRRELRRGTPHALGRRFSADEFRLQELGENISQGDLVRLMIEPGAKVSEGQPVMELETDKAVIEVPSSVSGIVKEVKVKEGEK